MPPESPRTIDEHLRNIEHYVKSGCFTPRAVASLIASHDAIEMMLTDSESRRMHRAATLNRHASSAWRRFATGTPAHLSPLHSNLKELRDEALVETNHALRVTRRAIKGPLRQHGELLTAWCTQRMMFRGWKVK